MGELHSQKSDHNFRSCFQKLFKKQPLGVTVDSHGYIRGGYYSLQAMLHCQLQHKMMPDRDLQRDIEAVIGATTEM